MFPIKGVLTGMTANTTNKLQLSVTNDELYKFGVTSKVPRVELESLSRPAGGNRDLRLTFSAAYLTTVKNFINKDVIVEIKPTFYNFKDPRTGERRAGYTLNICRIYETGST